MKNNEHGLFTNINMETCPFIHEKHGDLAITMAIFQFFQCFNSDVSPGRLEELDSWRDGNRLLEKGKNVGNFPSGKLT